jgi:hypothetical protein
MPLIQMRAPAGVVSTPIHPGAVASEAKAFPAASANAAVTVSHPLALGLRGLEIKS